jgi:FtsH-binding integral membrane protein
METGVFTRKKKRNQSYQVIDPMMYNLTMGVILVWGFTVNIVLVISIPPKILLGSNPLLFFLGYFASCFYGIYLFTKSINPLISFLGYNLVVIPFGLVLNMVVSGYDPSVVLDSMIVTGLVTVFMTILGASFPKFFQKIHWALTIALLSLAAVEVIEIFVFNIHHDIIDWIAALVFCGYIGYDWGRANQIPKTIDNAVDSAAALYMDIINLFVRILRILGRRRR